MKRQSPLFSAAGGTLAFLLTFAAFGRLTLAVALAAIAGALLAGLFMFAILRIRPR